MAMKLRWREHEAVLISIITAVLIGKYIYDMFRITGLRLTMLTGILIPEILAVMVLWLSYLWINRLIIPKLVAGKASIWKITVAIFQILFIAYLIGPVVNFASFYLNAGSQTATFTFPLGLGYHPQPFLNTFGGIGIATFLLSMYLCYAAVREFTIRQLQKGENSSEVTIVLVNESTLFLLRLLSPVIFASIFNLLPDSLYYNIYFACLLPTQAVFLINKFFLFPHKGEKSFYNWQVAGPLMFFSFLFSLLFSGALGQYWSILNVCMIYALQLLFVIPISWLDYKQDKNRILGLRGIEKALVKSKADLQLLRMQINPHFLFNVLNTIYGTALMEGAHRTAESTQKLGDMMRFMIHENTMDYIDVDKEIAYLRNYIDLQKLRIQTSADIRIDDEISYESSDFKIVPMLLIPLVENAFKHGIDVSEKSFINIQLHITKGILNYAVSNSIHQIRSEDYEKDNSGIGLNNVEQRLKMFYPGVHDLSCEAIGNTYVCKLNIDLRRMVKPKK
jgi:two-component system LytT family sensor kinase